MIGAELDSLSKRSRSYLDAIVPGTDPQIATLLHRYICVLISSNIDKSIQLILAEYARTHASPQFIRYVSKQHGRGRNFNTEAIITTLSLFDPAWGHRFSEEATRTDLKERLDSIAGIRNSIAHGELVNVSRPSLDGYFEASQKAIGLIKTIMLG